MLHLKTALGQRPSKKLSRESTSGTPADSCACHRSHPARVEAALFVARFWRDFLGSMLTHTVRSAMTKLLVMVIGFFLIPHARTATNPRLDLVVAIKLTKSVTVKGPDCTTEFQKNLDGVTRVLGQVPAGAHTTVIDITDHSFAVLHSRSSCSRPVLCR